MLMGFVVARSFTLPDSIKFEKGDTIGLYVCREDSGFGEIRIRNGSGCYWKVSNFASFAEKYLIVPRGCLISELGDIFCVKQKTLTAATPRRIYGSPAETIKHCPICGGQVVDSIRFPDKLTERVRMAFELGLIY